MNDNYCELCGQDSKADHSKCHMIAMERMKPCEHDNIRITLGGLWQCLECGAILDAQSKLVENQKDMPLEFNKVVDKMLDEMITGPSSKP